ncbi:MAG: pyrrolo-quinoline quinone, partial [Planctomycetaceae bacterium]|nr:pyrrolo-quinoline quinone [Planctomycetaceae bacterium]
KGQYIRNANVEEIEFKVDGPGSLENGKYTIGHDQAEQAAVAIEAKVGDLSGKARIRVIPDLPWAYNFDDGVIPVTWVGVRYRHVGLDFDLMSKLRSEDPQAANLYIYLHTAFTNFGPADKTFADTTPKQDWTTLLRYLGLADGEEKPKTVEEAEAKLGPSLQKLVDEKVLKSVAWSTWDRPTGEGEATVPEPKLVVAKGERKVDGNGVLCKITTIPLGTRSQGWLGHPDFHDYTVQSDVYCLKRDEKMPDIGIVAQRYTLDMMGASQKLQIRSWTPQLNRFSVDVPFTWEPETWYTMKFETSTSGGRAVLRGKVWKKGEAEPEEWTVTGEDELGNTQGSPGFFGNAKDAEIFYDNLTITPNQ